MSSGRSSPPQSPTESLAFAGSAVTDSFLPFEATAGGSSHINAEAVPHHGDHQPYVAHASVELEDSAHYKHSACFAASCFLCRSKPVPDEAFAFEFHGLARSPFIIAAAAYLGPYLQQIAVWDTRNNSDGKISWLGIPIDYRSFVAVYSTLAALACALLDPIVGGIAGQSISEFVASARDRERAGQHQRLDLRPQGNVDPGIDDIAHAAAGQLEDDVASVLDEEGVAGHAAECASAEAELECDRYTSV